jgi:trehalose/maltose hydrolase-like predicted phosphorylase
MVEDEAVQAMQNLGRILQRFFAHNFVSSTPHAEPAQADPKALERPFRVIIFDWDGTAVVDRREDATELARLSGELVDLHVWLVVVTGTNFGNIDRQYCQKVDPASRHHLIICVNRGSEVYGFDHTGQAIRRYLRVATPEEDRALTAVVDNVAAELRNTYHLDVGVVYDRLNRRKLDLIPVPEWADPPKAKIAELLQAVNQRLAAAHVPGGIHGVVQMVEQQAKAQGLDARITSDTKHIEIGLTDKADSVAWVRHDLIQPEGIPWRDVLIAGDELGPIGGFEGSDNRLRVGVGDAVVVSVGVEPNGVPPGVIGLGGGPARFRQLLAEQIAIHRAQPHFVTDAARANRREAIATALDTSPAPGWSLTIPAFDAARERTDETLLTLGNGALGMRGALAIPASVSTPLNLVAGLFADADDPQHLPVLASAPDWSRLRVSIDGAPLTVDNGATVTRTLDLRRSLLVTEWGWQPKDGQAITLRTLRGVSLANRALTWQIGRLDVTQPAAITLETWLEPLDPLLRPQREGVFLQTWRTAGGRHTLAAASTALLDVPDRLIAPVTTERQAYRRWEWQAQPDQPAMFYRLAAFLRDDPSPGTGAGVLDVIYRARRVDPAMLFEAHVRAWEDRWQVSDVMLSGDESVQAALRFALFELNSAANPDDPHVSIGARALTGPGYHGHVFWDTEIYLLPYYTLTWPAAAQAMLRYRYLTLPAARAKAQQMGYRGALYAWESADTGAEATPESVVDPTGQVIPVYSGRDEQHISADIAYAVWQYWTATEDSNFFLDAGAEIILETARFWASRGTLEDDGRYHIRHVIGPDEYHENVDDNAYTNNMARWNLERGLEVAALLAELWPDRWHALRAQLALNDDELALWRAVAERLFTGLDAATGVYAQFAGYDQREPIDLTQYADRTQPMDVVLGHERVQQTQVIKQADVVMLLALLWDQIDPAVCEASFRYYEPRTSHGSSLSPSIYALVAARLGDNDTAVRYLRHAIEIDNADRNGNEAMGVHIATQGGLWQAVILGFAGVQIRDDGLHIDPHLPEAWTNLQFSLHWRGRQLAVAFTQVPLAIALTMHGRPLDITLGATPVHLEPETPARYQWEPEARQWRALAS